MTRHYWIWSFEHNAWWAPNRNGYTSLLNEAGVYTEKEAYDICCQANLTLGCYSSALAGRDLNEAMVPVQGD